MLRIDPSDEIEDMVLGEDYAFELDISKELDTKTVNSYTYKIYNRANEEVTDTLSGSQLYLVGIITFGVKAAVIGKYELRFKITCNELLPDDITPYSFTVIMYINVN